MDAKREFDLQAKIVTSIAKSLTKDWTTAVVNIEIDVVDGDQTENCLAISFAEDRGGWSRNSFSLPFECYDYFVELRDSMHNTNADLWKVCTLEMNLGGKYRFSFSYDPPRRLNGIHDDEAMFKSYLPKPL